MMLLDSLNGVERLTPFSNLYHLRLNQPEGTMPIRCPVCGAEITSRLHAVDLCPACHVVLDSLAAFRHRVLLHIALVASGGMIVWLLAEMGLIQRAGAVVIAASMIAGGFWLRFRSSGQASVLVGCGAVLLGVWPRLGAATVDVGWPSGVGDGTCAVPSTGLALVSDGGKARLGWSLAVPLGRIKSKDLAEGEFLGSASGCIVADGIVYASTFRPSGEVLNERTVCRYWPSIADQVRSLRQIDADDVLVAVDAESGKLLWQAVEPGSAINVMIAKRGYFGASPAAGSGRVFSLGGLGVVRAYDATTGKKTWEFTLTAFHAAATPIKAKALADKAALIPERTIFEDQRSGPVVVGDLVVVPDLMGGLVGLDAASGAQRWARPGRMLARSATPAVWRDSTGAVLLCPISGEGPGTGQITAIDAGNGTVLWTLGGLGQLGGALSIGGDRLLANTRGDLRKGQASLGERDRWGLVGCWQLGRGGARALWVMEDSDANLMRCKPDRGLDRLFAIDGGIGYGLVGRRDAALPDGKFSLISFAMSTGAVLNRLDWPADRANAGFPLAVDGRLFVAHDLGHAGRGGAIWVHRIDGKGGIAPAGGVALAGLDVLPVNAYEVLAEMPWWRGRFYTKTQAGLACVDVRAR
jgi:outer membrane protein assembly factor BamB